MTRRRSWNAVCAMLMPTLLVTAACGDTDSPTGPSQQSLGWSFNETGVTVGLIFAALFILIGGFGTFHRESASDAVQGQTSWRGLVVAPEQRCAPYDADDYQYPQSVEDRIVAELGGVYGPYTGQWFANKSETDIEHMVARSEAHDSGLCAADNATRRRFATDLLNLTLASPSVNRNQKRDHAAAEWLPDRNRYWFADRVTLLRLL